ncbi:MAG TPA: 3-hydroxyacyl-CoA dehydrogenase [Candidatus Udaeobacter sp.]|nr:3-hydroxyacyl-CoA dehydrogenase [Candidatus Udaeobacter sp.]
MSGAIAIIGCGLVGRAWATVFARAGRRVRLFDADAAVANAARDRIAGGLTDLQRYGLIGDVAAVLERIETEQDLGAALAGAFYAQESVFERVDVKREAFAAIDRVVGPETLIGSSSSGIPASAFTADVSCRARCLIAHPVNPPHVIPVVELVPAPWTARETVTAVRGLMEEVGQAPVELAREIEGFLVNRLQAVLLMEAWRLVEEGYATVADIDRAIADGLGLRWSFMGPFETIDLNAPGGVADYARRLGPLYQRIAASCREHRVWDEALIAEVEAQRRRQLPADRLAERSAWRDRRLMALALHKRQMAAEDREESDANRSQPEA